MHFSRRAIHLLLTLTAIGYLSGVSSSAQTPPTTAATPSKGQRIGTIITDAITAASPGIGALVKILWPQSADQSKKVSQTDAQAALNSPQSQQALKDSALEKAKPQIQKLGQISGEMALISTFGKAAAQAATNVTTMQALLSATPAPSNLLTRLQEEWGFASDWINQVKDVTDKQIDDAVDQTSIVTQLKALRDANRNVAGRIANRLKDKKNIADVDLKEVAAFVNSLSDLLNGINATAVVELDMLQRDVAALVAWASKGQPITTTIAPNAALIGVANKSTSRANALLKSSK
jgi:hypothetical protein